jgi:hypothetical protein
VSGDGATALTAVELERLLREPGRPAQRHRIALSATSLSAVARQPGLVDRLQARYRFTGEESVRGEPMLGFETKRLLLALTLDYETWHPLPLGLSIDWQRDVLEPARRFAALAEAARARVTFFVEMGEYLFLETFDPSVHARIVEQLRQLVSAGHAVELHLHPDWLPELGARRTAEGWHWDRRFAHAHDYPGDLAQLFARCRRAIEEATRAGGEIRAVRAFRAGAYRAQPFGRISAALVRAGITCDSSVFRGGVSAERGYDYTHAFSSHQPYLCSFDDPQLLAQPGDDAIVELPIATLEFGRRWSVDGADQARFGDDLLDYLDTLAAKGFSGRSRALWRARERLSALLERLSRGRLRRLPRYPARAPAGELRHGNDYFVAIGHTKGQHDFTTLAAQLARVNQGAPAEWITLGEMAELAREDLSRTEAWRATRAAAGSPLAVGSTSAAPSLDAVAVAVERALPWAGSVARVLGSGARELAARLAPRFPWKSFAASDPAAGAVSEGSRFAAVILATSASVPGATLNEWARELGPQGRLVVPVAFEAERLAYPDLPSARAALLREWRYRLETAGFGNVRLHPIPEGGIAGVVLATPGKAPTARDHLLAVMDWLYEAVAPADDPATGIAPREVLGTGRALCLGYVSALGAILERDGFAIEYATLVARDHARGRPPHGIDSHEVLQVREPGGHSVVLDAMANVMIPHGLLQVLRDPTLANGPAEPDARYRARRYELYATSYLYERAFEACLRSSLDVLSYDASGSWRSRLKLLRDLGRRRVYRKDGSHWREILAFDPRVTVRERKTAPRGA